MSDDFETSFTFLFENTYEMWKSDLEKIFRIGTRGNDGGCNFSSCILVLIGIESFAHCFSSKNTDVGAVEEFVGNFFPDAYKGRMKKIHDLFRHGLAHNFFPKSEFNLANTTMIPYWVEQHGRVKPLGWYKRDLDGRRKNDLVLSPSYKKPYVIIPQILFLDTVNVMESLKSRVVTDQRLQKEFIKNCSKVRRTLRHIS